MPSDLRSFVRGVAAAGAVPALGLVTGPLMARALGPDGRGELAAILQPLTLVDSVAAVGLPAALTVFVARGLPSRLALRLSVPLAGIVTSLAFLGLCAWSLVVAERYDLSIAALIGCQCFLFIGVLLNLLRGVVAGQGHWRRLDAERVMTSVLRLLAIAALVLVGASWAPAFALGILLAGSSAGLLVLLNGFRWSPGTPAVHDSRMAGRRLRSFAYRGWPGSMAASANARLDQAILPALVASDVLGYYAVAVTLAELPVLVSSVVSRHILTSVAAGSFDRGSRRLLLVGGTVCLTLVVLLAVGGGPVISLIFGEDFAPASEALQLLVLAAGIGVAGQWVTSAHTGAGRPGISSVSHGVGCVVTVLGLVIIRDDPTLTNIALVAVASQAASTVPLFFHFLFRMGRKKKLPVPTVDELYAGVS